MKRVEIADRIFVLTHPQFNVNCTLIVGDGAAMLIDTLSTNEQGAQLGAAVRELTPHPWTLVNTHFHFDHCFGNAALADERTPIWGHPECAVELTERGEHWRRVWTSRYGIDLEGVPIRPPDHLVKHSATLTIGGREVVLSFPGRGHTSGDVIAWVDSVLVAGDLVEQGGPPWFVDAFPLEWPEALTELVNGCTAETVVVPGHGDLVDIEFLREQHAELSTLDWLIREGHADGAPVDRAAAASPLNRWGDYGRAQSRVAVERGYAQLDGA